MRAIRTKELRRKFPKVRAIVLTVKKDIKHFKYAMSNGARGYILKDGAFEELVMAIKVMMKGKNFVSPAISEYITEQFLRSLGSNDVPSLEILTNRERQVLALIAKGAANKNIASSLRISIRTVESHRSRLIHKLGINTPAGLVKYAISRGLM
jgi:two-component system response regulator NreC